MNDLIKYLATTKQRTGIVEMDMHAMYVIKRALVLSRKRALERAEASMSDKDKDAFYLMAEDCHRVMQDLNVVIESRRGI